MAAGDGWMDLLSKLSSNIVVRSVKNERGMERCCLPGIAVISRDSQGIAVSNFFTRASGLATVLRRENVDTTATTVAGSRLHVCGERRNKPRESFLIMVSQFASFLDGLLVQRTARRIQIGRPV